MRERIGVYICHCGGNISDYVDVEELGRMMGSEQGVVISTDVMFACSDAGQKQMVADIQEQKLDAMVVASCSPKLHLHTFQGVAERAGLNPSNYVQVNIREQCSWPHSDRPREATVKAAGLIRAGILRVRHAEALTNIEIPVVRAALVIGAGVAGMRAAIDLARLGNEVYLVEKENTVGGRVAHTGKVFMSGQEGKNLVEQLHDEIKKLSNIKVFTNASVEKTGGSLGNFLVEVLVNTATKSEKLSLNVGAVLVTTGMDTYHPAENEFGYGTSPRIMTLPEFDQWLMKAGDSPLIDNKPVRRIAYIYCVGNRQKKGENKYCSRMCCTAAINTALQVKEKFPNVINFHLFRDVRTYGKQEILYEKSSKQGDIYVRWDEKEPPVVELLNDTLNLKVKDYLTSKKEVEIPADLVVLVTGAVARADSKDIAEVFKIPVGADRFFNEIHPKLKPVETVIKGVYIGGACQGPKNISEAVQSSLSAVAKMNAFLGGDTVSLDPAVARVNPDVCAWCGKCAEACDYDALSMEEVNGKTVAVVNKATCAGCGICAPVCPVDAIDLARFTNAEIEGMIDGFARDVVIRESSTDLTSETPTRRRPSNVSLKDWKEAVAILQQGPMSIPELTKRMEKPAREVTWLIMTMNKFGTVVADGLDDSEAYFMYKLKNE